jgi:ATP-binding cassette subfamily F protein 3
VAAPAGRTPALQRGRARHDERRQAESQARRLARAEQARRRRIDELEARIADTEARVRELEVAMAEPGFYTDRAAAQPVIDRHQAMMWEVGDLMRQWEELQTALSSQP